MAYHLAVDLGTCNTVAVIHRAGGAPRALLFDGTPMLPSSVFVDHSGIAHVGRDADRLMVTDPARYEPHPKRHMDEHTVLLGDRELPVIDLLTAILRRVAAEAELTGVQTAGGTVLTCPVAWGPRRRALLRQAALAAGLGQVALVEEPVAAATYCLTVLGQRIGPGRCIAVFDFGGGTLDVTVVRHEPDDGLRVLASGGLDDLGGADIDEALLGYLRRSNATGSGNWHVLAHAQTTADIRDRRLLWTEVRAAKEMLSRSTHAPIQVPGQEWATHLTRDELERIAGPLVDRAVEETRRVLHRCGVPPSRLDAILLVGGSSRLPLVSSRLHQAFGVSPLVPEQPELPVAYGALFVPDGAPGGAVPMPIPGMGPAPSAGPAPSRPIPAQGPGQGPGQPYGASPMSPQRPAPDRVPTASAAAPAPGTAPAFGSAPAYGQPGDYGQAATYRQDAAQGQPAVYRQSAAQGQPVVYGQDAAGSAPAAPAPAAARPSIVIGPGVTIEGNVHLRGAGAGPAPYDDDIDDDDEDDDDDEPVGRTGTRRRGARSGGVLRVLRQSWLLAVPLVITLVANEPARKLVLDGLRSLGRLVGIDSTTP